MERIYGFLNKKSPKHLIETNKRAYTIANVKLTINSVRASSFSKT